MTEALTPYDPAPSPTETRQTARLEEVPELYRRTHERLAVELSLHMEDAEGVFARHHYSPEEAADLCESPAFIALLERVTKEVRESGLSYKIKMRAVAEDLIPYAHELATDPFCSPAVRADLIKWSAKVSGLEPKDKDGDAKIGSGLTLSITFSGQAPTQIVSAHEPITIEQQ